MISALNQELLNALDLRVLAVQRTVAGRWWNFSHVLSPFSRLWLILDGEAVVTHHGRKFRLRPNQLHLVPPFAVHDCSCSRRLDHYHLHFVARMPTGIDLFSLLDCDYQLPAANGALDLFKRLERIYPERKLPCFDPNREEYKQFSSLAEPAANADDAVNGFEARGILSLLLAQFLRSARGHEGVHARVNRQFLAVQEFIHANMRRPIALADLARVVELHPTYFSDQFKRTVGVRPLDYLMRRRVERAQYLLLTSHASVKEIADAVGIADPAYFSRVFTKLCRTSPSAYRASHGA
ncbi:MAG TPA: helix-turn-helix domain-containing protein [Verrucomicrobiae bacterium]